MATTFARAGTSASYILQHGSVSCRGNKDSTFGSMRFSFLPINVSRARRSLCNPSVPFVRKRHGGALGTKMESQSGRRGEGWTVTGARGAGQSAPLEVPEMLRLLQEQMRDATKIENYAEAAKMRDLIRSLQEKDPVTQLRQLLSTAIAEEDFEEAARYRDELKKLAPPPEPKKSLGAAKCFSDTTTKGIRVRVRSIYVRDRSDPTRQQYFFAYRIVISNESDESVQLLNRHWLITDATGRVEEVRGPGVIGEQPILRPGTSFEYTSACPLRTPSGLMEGDYEMVHVQDAASVPFLVKVGGFSLNVDDTELND